MYVYFENIKLLTSGTKKKKFLNQVSNFKKSLINSKLFVIIFIIQAFLKMVMRHQTGYIFLFKDNFFFFKKDRKGEKGAFCLITLQRKEGGLKLKHL